MNTELFIAKRLVTDKNFRNNLTRPILRIAVFAIALSLTVMILSVAIVTGFKNEIRSKVIGFGSHIQIINLDANYTYETNPISSEQEFLPGIKTIEGIEHIQPFATKPGIIKTNEDIQVAVLKGVDREFDWTFFEKSLTAGSTFQVRDTSTGNQVIISNHLAKILKLNVDDSFIMYFVQQPLRMRKFIIAGIYETSIEEFDKLFILADIKHIRKLNDWDSNQISGFEILINDFQQLESIKYQVNEKVGFNYDPDAEKLKVVSIRDKFPQIFDWLELQNINVWIILILMITVAGFNMISGLLILILEKTNMIGVLKGLGSRNASIRKIFLYQAVFITGKGMLWGNIAGLTLCFIQYQFSIFRLDPATYYIDQVPIHFHWLLFILLNAGTIVVTYLMLILPSLIITRISPIKAIRFN